MTELQQDQRATDALLYSMKPSAVSSRSYRDSIQPINGSTFASGAVIKFNIPSGRKGTYLDTSQSYLKFKVTNTTNVAVNPATGVWGFIQRLDIYSGSNLLESINEYGRLHQALYDMGMNVNDKATAGMFEGADVNTFNAAETAALTSLDNPNRIGKELSAKDANNYDQETYYIPIISGVIGQLADKYIPLGEMSADLRVEVYLYKANIALYSASTAPTYTIGDFTYEAQIVEVDGSVQSEIDQATLGYYRIHATSWSQYNSTVSSGDGSKSFLIPARFASLKNLLVVQQKQSISNGETSTHAIIARDLGDLTEYYFKIGSLQVPQTPVKVIDAGNNNNGAEAFAELKKSMHNMGTLDGGLMNTVQYRLSNGDGDDNASSGAFLIGQELESFAHKNDVLTAGVNTLGANVFFEATYDTASAALNLYAFAHYDMVLELQGGVMRVRK